MKALFWTVGSILSLAIASIPEVVLYFLYGIINPQTEMARVITILSFVFLGGGICIGFGVLGVMCFVAVTKAVLD